MYYLQLQLCCVLLIPDPYLYNVHYSFSISLPHQGPARKPKLIVQGVTIFTKLNDLNAEKTQSSGDLNPKQCLTCSVGCCTAIQETRIPSEMCAGETCITDGKHASLVICVQGNTHPQGYECGKHFTQGNTHPYDTGAKLFDNTHESYGFSADLIETNAVRQVLVGVSTGLVVMCKD